MNDENELIILRNLEKLGTWGENPGHLEPPDGTNA